ncbi:hypothetical protein DYB35_009268 [Aphanomyces astaci]|uniref:Uncharacterized protein n=1 Tax=Aphanomyces astaci TaxID=112090 RepID=A0A3R6WEI2_APHAT|nr:hypothetical protein DYB35_009268 [Aphanomyces astaci]
MVASAALQSRMTIPPAYHEDSLHHYKLVDSSAISKQRADRDKIIQEIEAKRASKRAASKMVHPFESALSVHAQQRDLAVVEQLVKAKKDAEAQIYQLKQQLHSSPHGLNHHNTEKAASRSHSKQHDQRSNHVAQLQHQHHRQPPSPSRGQEEPKANPMKTPAVLRPATLSGGWVPTDRSIVTADNDEDLAFDHTDGDEDAAPAFDMGPRTASLLTNEAKLRERKQKRVEDILLEEDEKLTPFKARDAPPVMDADVELVEHLRKERVAARAAELLAASKLPSRLADAAAKAKPKSPTQSRRVRIKAAPVPDFVMMQTEWKAALQRAKLSKASTRVDAFSVTDPDKLAALQKKKQERLERQKLKEDAERAAAEAKRKHAYDKVMESAKGQVQVVETEAQKLRTKAVQAKLKQLQIKEKAEVDPDEAAKAKAEDNKRSFQEAIQRNKERILGAVAARPTLMERFAIDKKKEEGKGEEDLVDAMNVKSAADDDDYADDTET